MTNVCQATKNMQPGGNQAAKAPASQAHAWTPPLQCKTYLHLLPSPTLLTPNPLPTQSSTQSFHHGQFIF